MSPTVPIAELDLKNPDIYADRVPYDLFARLREEDPVHWNPETDGAGFWALTRFADITEVSRQPALFSSAYEHGGHRIFNENEVGLTGAGEAAIGIPLISQDPPVHSEWRRNLMKSLSPVRLGDIEARISQRVTTLLDQVPLGAPVDIVPLLSAPLPLLTLAELLGVPSELWRKLYHWTNAFVGEDDPELRQSPEAMAETLGEFFAFAKDLFELRRREPGEDVASMLANAEIDGAPVTFQGFIANLILVLVGGNETTRNTISHTMMAFAAHPEQWERVRANPDILKSGVREMVRFASPVLHMRRTATADTRIGAQRIAKGDKVVLWYAAGNRDAAAISEPDRFDIGRVNVPHVGFGTGQHVCAGSRLAEMQLRVVFGQLAARVSRFEVVKAPRRFRSNFLNGLKNLDVVLAPA